MGVTDIVVSKMKVPFQEDFFGRRYNLISPSVMHILILGESSLALGSVAVQTNMSALINIPCIVVCTRTINVVDDRIYAQQK